MDTSCYLKIGHSAYWSGEITKSCKVESHVILDNPRSSMHSLPSEATSLSTANSKSCCHNHHRRRPRGLSFARSFLARRPLSRLLIQRLTGLRADLEDSRNLVQQRLVLDSLTALQSLDIVCLSIDLLRELRLCHLVGGLGAAITDRIANFGVDFLDGDDIVGAVDFGETLTFDAAFAGLWWN